jgi:conjugal transfer pilus assembly protein TraK
MIPLKRSALLGPLLLAFSLPAMALQILEAKDGETLLARISQKEVTRIAFERGRIRKVTGNAGEFVLEKDEERGQVFIRPATGDATKPINVFVTSERSTVALLLQPVDTPSDTILIREGRSIASAGARSDRNHPHVRTIKNLLIALANDTVPDDMEIRAPGRELALWPGVRLTLEQAYVGATHVGEKYLLGNVGEGAIELSARDLYKSGVMAVALEASSLRPGEATVLFVIRERHAHD